jgi:hypothetical protein
MQEYRRRFPRPWKVEEGPVFFIVLDANGQKLAYVYFESEPGRRSAAKLLSHNEARRIAVNIARLSELLNPPKAFASPGSASVEQSQDARAAQRD